MQRKTLIAVVRVCFISANRLPASRACLGYSTYHVTCSHRNPDSSLSRFTQADSIVPGGVQGWDRYAYVNNSPVNFNDPTGHDYDCGISECPEDMRADNGPRDDGGGGGGSGNPITTIFSHYNEMDEQLAGQGGCSNLVNSAFCLDTIAIVSQDIATLSSITGALATASSIAIGCATGGIVGCAGGYGAGLEFHVAVTNPMETAFSTLSLAATIQSDIVTGDNTVDSNTWGIGEDTETSLITWGAGTLPDPFIDAAVDIYASGYNHGFFCGVSTILDCLP